MCPGISWAFLDLVKIVFNSTGLGWSLRIRISSKLLGDNDTAGLETALGVAGEGKSLGNRKNQVPVLAIYWSGSLRQSAFLCTSFIRLIFTQFPLFARSCAQ